MKSHKKVRLDLRNLTEAKVYWSKPHSFDKPRLCCLIISRYNSVVGEPGYDFVNGYGNLFIVRGKAKVGNITKEKLSKATAYYIEDENYHRKLYIRFK